MSGSTDETTFELLVKNLSDDGQENFTIKTDPVNLAGVDWTAEANICKEVYQYPNPRTPHRMYTWMRYCISIYCDLPDDVKYFNCNAKIEHFKNWTVLNEGTATEQQTHSDGQESDKNVNAPNSVERYEHRYTQDSRAMGFAIIVDPGQEPKIRPKNRVMKITLHLKLVDPLPPIRTVVPSFQETPWTDLEIIFDDKTATRTCKCLLALCSPYFRALIFGDFKEKNINSIELHNVKADEFEELLAHIYPNARKPVTENNVETLLFMADRFLMTAVTEECEKFLLIPKSGFKHERTNPKSKHSRNPVTLQDKRLLADLYRLNRLKQQCDCDLAGEIPKCTFNVQEDASAE